VDVVTDEYLRHNAPLWAKPPITSP
jgi:hypothetical protein